MRRTDRKMGQDFALSVIEKAAYCVISMIDEDGNPYALPFSFVYHDKEIFIHSAKKGTKVDIFARNPRVCITCVGEVKVPDLYNEKELDSFIMDSKNLFASKVYTTEYESAIFDSRVTLVQDNDKKIEALKLLCEKYTPCKMKYFDYAMETSLNVTNIYSLTIENLTGKRKKFDSHGEEMKNGRME